MQSCLFSQSWVIFYFTTQVEFYYLPLYADFDFGGNKHRFPSSLALLYWSTFQFIAFLGLKFQPRGKHKSPTIWQFVTNSLWRACRLLITVPHSFFPWEQALYWFLGDSHCTYIISGSVLEIASSPSCADLLGMTWLLFVLSKLACLFHGSVWYFLLSLSALLKIKQSCKGWGEWSIQWCLVFWLFTKFLSFVAYHQHLPRF